MILKKFTEDCLLCLDEAYSDFAVKFIPDIDINRKSN